MGIGGVAVGMEALLEGGGKVQQRVRAVASRQRVADGGSEQIYGLLEVRAVLA